MATIPIKPVQITTDGRMQGEITGVDPSCEDCLTGWVSNKKPMLPGTCPEFAGIIILI